jgi:hypothetical protein
VFILGLVLILSLICVPPALAQENLQVKFSTGFDDSKDDYDDLEDQEELANLKSDFSTGFDYSTGDFDDRKDQKYLEDLQIKFSTGFDYSTGDYGDPEDTEILYFPFTTKAIFGNWAAKLTVPYLRITGPGAVVGGGDVTVNQGGGGTRTTESGLGDIVAGLTYTVDIEKFNSYVDFTGKIKFPTADEDKGLGTGETDYTLLVDVTKIFGKAYIFGGVGRKFVGENAQLQLDDIWIFNVGGGYQVSKKLGIGGSYDFRESASSSDNPSEGTGYLTYKITDSILGLLYGVIGFSDGSPDTGVGLQFSYKFEPFEMRP